MATFTLTLDTPPTLELPIENYHRFLRAFVDVPGWFYPQSAATWDILLSYQEAHGIVGNLLEIGVYQGKSAGMAALHRQGEESCVFVDPLPMDGIRQRLEQLLPDAKCEYIQELSQYLPRHAFVRDAARDFRWIHIDGEHSAQAMQNDLTIAETLLSDRGILVVDDFFSPSYPQITQAVFRFLDANPGRLMLLLCGYNKGYLCRPRAAREYLGFIKDAFYLNMAKRGMSRITVCKTSEPSDMNTFGLIDRYMDLDYRGPDWDLENIHI
jgi:predicted O-methyltransferase YrrM